MTAIIAALAAVAAALIVAGSGSAGSVTGHGDLVYSSPVDGMYDIYVLKADGTTVNLTHDKDVRADVTPHWSPDGSQVLFVREWTHGGSSVMLMKSDGSNLRNLTPVGATGIRNVDPNWSPDAHGMVFASNRDGNFDLYWMKIGSAPVRITKTKAPVQNFEPDWSPMGDLVAYTRFAPLKATGSASVLYMASIWTNQTWPITKTSPWLGDRSPVWSPDGETIAFYSDRARGNLDVFLLDLTISFRPIRITTGKFNETQPAWGDHGNSLVYVSEETGATEFWAIDLKTAQPGPSNPYQLTFDGAKKAHPDWMEVPVPQWRLPTLSR